MPGEGLVGQALLSVDGEVVVGAGRVPRCESVSVTTQEVHPCWDVVPGKESRADIHTEEARRQRRWQTRAELVLAVGLSS